MRIIDNKILTYKKVYGVAPNSCFSLCQRITFHLDFEVSLYFFLKCPLSNGINRVARIHSSNSSPKLFISSYSVLKDFSIRSFPFLVSFKRVLLLSFGSCSLETNPNPALPNL